MDELSLLQEQLETSKLNLEVNRRGRCWYEIYTPGPAGGVLKSHCVGNMTTIRAYIQGYTDGKKKGLTETLTRKKGRITKLRNRLRAAENRGYLQAVEEIDGIHNGIIPDKHNPTLNNG
ncbi:hypothetical protein GCM10028806_33570 [Spirosoma terrae]|uniref:Uncharacterized protein n=1 Tax=Spirosoma terrae TaxID=1968276 RepID=A0A6L9L8J5_9BACT|nr:hypothetical protein [Spirosoma terrae]NDU95672.1 hypothetical protein [Spirosoma terrae]